MQSIEQIREKIFGFDSFRPMQQDIIETALAGRDVVVVMPTGGGKSLCYQLPALVDEGVTIVISPLISLMEDQIAALHQLGVAAEMLHSGIEPEVQRDIIDSLQKSVDTRPRMIYVSPERVMSSSFQRMMQDIDLARIVIDEAHCISVWGHDFRPEYTRLGELRKVFPQTPFMALTATADSQTRDDIVNRLGVGEVGRVFVSSFDRPNIQYTVEPKVNAFDKLQRIIRGHRDSSGIVYCLSKKTTDSIAKKLSAKGFRARAYHADLSLDERREIYQAFQQDKLQVVVATIAFGMGIDKPNVRYVVHWDMPRNIESFYQESGRAGRDGLPAESIILYDPRDQDILEYFKQQNQQYQVSHITESERLAYYDRQNRKQDALVNLCQDLICRRKQLLNYFEEKHEGDCGSCDVCLSGHVAEESTTDVQKALSAVLKVKQKFGLQYIIDVLVGKQTHQLQARFHQRLSVFGIGADKTRSEWEWILMQLIGLGYLRVDRDNYRVLKCQKTAVEVLKGVSTVSLVPYRTSLKHATDLPLDLSEKGLFEALRIKRAALAEQENVPAYIIAQDSVLIDLIRQRPRKLEDFLGVSGFGQVKQEKYGPAFLGILEMFQEGA